MNRFINNLPPLIRRRKNKDSDVTYAIIKALEEVLIQTEDDIVASKIHSFLHSAKGWSLDEWGSWFNLSRKEKETDEQFRKRIIDKIKIPRGTNAAIKWGIRDYLGDFVLPINITETWTKVFINNKHRLNSDYYLIGKKYNIALFEVRILKDIKEIADKYFNGDEALAKYELLKVINEYKSSGTHATLVFGKARETGTNESIEDIIKEEIKDKDPVLPEGEQPNLEVEVRDTWDNIFYTNRSQLNGLDLFIGSGTNARVIQILISETLEDIANTYFDGNLELADATIKKLVYQTKPENTIPYITYGATVITGKEFTDLQTDIRELTKLEDLIINMMETKEQIFFINDTKITSNSYLLGKKYNEGIKEFLINKSLKEIADKKYNGNTNNAHTDIKRLIYKYYPDKKVPYIVYGVHDLTDNGSSIVDNKPIEKPKVTLTKEELEKLTETEIEKIILNNVKITTGKELTENKDDKISEYDMFKLDNLIIRNTWEDVTKLNGTKLNGNTKLIGSKNNAGIVEVILRDTLGDVADKIFNGNKVLAKAIIEREIYRETPEGIEVYVTYNNDISWEEINK